MFAFSTCLLAAVLAAPEQIHLSFRHDPQTSVTVQWRAEASAGKLEVGAASGKYDMTIEAERQRTSGGTFFVAEATALEPGTLYHYRVSAGGLASPDLTFATAPRSGDDAQFRFIAFGDSRGGYPVFGQAVNNMLNDSPDLFMFTGDATSDGSDDEWDQWFAAGEPAMSVVPFMPVYGNHDALSKIYTDRFALPENADETSDKEFYYSFVFGNAKFIVLNDNYALGVKTTKLDGPQFQWIKKELATSREQWIFVFNHQPFFSASNKHGSDRNLQRMWMPLLDEYEVDMVFNGHDHNYERSKPMRNNEAVGSMHDGTVYVVAAGVGADLYENGNEYWTAKSASVENYAVVDIDGPNLTFTAKRLDGTVLDQFTSTRKPRQFATPETAAAEIPTVLAGPLWHCGAGGAPISSLIYLAIPLWLFRKQHS